MSTPPAPLPGQMYLYDYMEPPLLDNSYRLRVSTNTQSADGTKTYPIPEAIAYFDIAGPRFRTLLFTIARCHGSAFSTRTTKPSIHRRFKAA